MEHFRAPRNQIFSSPPSMVGQGLGSSDNLCIPGHYLKPFKFKSCIDLKSNFTDLGKNILIWGKVILGTFWGNPFSKIGKRLTPIIKDKTSEHRLTIT